MESIEIKLDNSKIILTDHEGRTILLKEGKAALDFHLARDVIRNFREMITRHLGAGSTQSRR